MHSLSKYFWNEPFGYNSMFLSVCSDRLQENNVKISKHFGFRVKKYLLSQTSHPLLPTWSTLNLSSTHEVTGSGCVVLYANICRQAWWIRRSVADAWCNLDWLDTYTSVTYVGEKWQMPTPHELCSNYAVGNMSGRGKNNSKTGMCFLVTMGQYMRTKLSTSRLSKCQL